MSLTIFSPGATFLRKGISTSSSFGAVRRRLGERIESDSFSVVSSRPRLAIMSTTSGPPERNYYNAYDPSSAAALAFTILFAVSAGVYIVQAIRGKAYWMWPLLVGVLGEVAGESVLQSHFQVLLELELILYLTLGYAARYASAKNQTSREAWLAQLLLIILAPNVRMDTRSSFIFSHRGGHRCSLVLNSFFWRSTVSRRSRLHPLRQTHVLRRS
jgi:hypothetical protein